LPVCGQSSTLRGCSFFSQNLKVLRGSQINLKEKEYG